MTRTHLSSFLIGILLFTFPVRAQFVKETYNDPIYSDNFSSDAGNWKIQSNADNLFLIQDGQYLLKRKNTETAYSVFSNYKITIPSFEIAVRMTLEKSDLKESAAGVIFMAQEDGTGAFLFEFNSQQEYRLKQLVGVNYKLLTGDNKTSGWVSSTFISPKNEANLIQIRCSNRNYDIYINQHYLFSFTELAYKSGKVGINVGPASNIRVNNFTVFGPGNSADKTTNENSSCEEVKSRLKEELSTVRSENQLLKDSLVQIKKEMKILKEKNATKSKHLE